MASEWENLLLKDFAKFLSGGTPSKMDARYWNGNIPWISAKSMIGNRYFDSDLRLTEEGLKKGSRLVPKDTILLLVRGSALHQKIPVGITTAAVAFNQDVKAIIPDKRFLPLFLLYSFESKFNELLGKVENTGIGAGKLDTEVLNKLCFLCPPLKEQEDIVSFIKSFDDKVELNRQMNATLESMAQALFKSWFVDFDPVLDKALAAGNPIPDELQSKAAARLALGDARKALPVEIQALFPSSFVLTEEMGWIPEGWDVESMINMVNSISETYPLRKVDSVIFLNTGDILDGLVLHSTYSSTKDLPGQAKKSIKKGDILYSEIRPQNKRFSYIDFDAEDYVVSTKLMVLRAKDSYDPLFCYFILKQEETISLLQYIAETRSGTFPQITFKELENIKFALPANNKLIESFGELFLHDFFKKSSELQRNSKLLANLRDTLLPKLLSGELRIPDAENLAAEVL
jgi:type I restriction enzyme S subunit